MPMIGKIDPKTTKTSDEEPAANRIHHGRAPIWDSAVNFWRYGGKERITAQTVFLCKRFLERGNDPYFFAALVCPNPDQWNAAFLRILMVKETFAVQGQGRLHRHHPSIPGAAGEAVDGGFPVAAEISAHKAETAEDPVQDHGVPYAQGAHAQADAQDVAETDAEGGHGEDGNAHGEFHIVAGRHLSGIFLTIECR